MGDTLTELLSEFLKDVIQPLINNPFIFTFAITIIGVVLIIRLIVNLFTWSLQKFLNLLNQATELSGRLIQAENTYREDRSKKVHEFYSKCTDNLSQLLISHPSPHNITDEALSDDVRKLSSQTQSHLTLFLAHYISEKSDSADNSVKLLREYVHGSPENFVRNSDTIKYHITNLVLSDTKLNRINLQEIATGDLLKEVADSATDLVRQLSFGQVLRPLNKALQSATNFLK